MNIVTRNTKVICAHLQPKLCGVSKEEGNGVVTGKRKCEEVRDFVRVKSISYFYLLTRLITIITVYV